MKHKHLVLSTIIVILLSLWPHPALGQDSPIRVSVDRADIRTDELVTLVVTVIDSSAQQPRPILPHLDGLAVVDLDIATDVKMINGEIHTEVMYTYVLQPRRTGLLTIPPVTVEIDGIVYKAPVISVKVSQGSAPAPSSGNAGNPVTIAPPPGLVGQDFFVQAEASPSNPYQGQQIIYSFRFYQALQVYRPPQYEAPLLAEFETMGLPVREYNVDVGERTYLVTEIRTALFARRSGLVTINPGRLMLPGNIYEEPVELFTEPIQLDVIPLPESAPTSFNGAVGQFEIQAWLSPNNTAQVSKPSTLFVAIDGVGNLQDLPELTWPNTPGFQAYNMLTSLTTEIEDERLTGTRIYERVLIPNQIGNYTIPEISLTYFDPALEQYRVVQTAPIPVNVIAAPTPEPTAVAAAAATATPATRAYVVDIPVQPPPESAGWLSSFSIPSPLLGLTTLLMCSVMGLFAMMGASGLVWWHKQQQPPPLPEPEPVAVAEPTAAEQRIHPALAAAMQRNEDNYRAVDQALRSYLADKLNVSMHGLTQSSLIRKLKEYGLGDALIYRVDYTLSACEKGRYSPMTQDSGWALMAEVDELLFDLDRTFR